MSTKITLGEGCHSTFITGDINIKQSGVINNFPHVHITHANWVEGEPPAKEKRRIEITTENLHEICQLPCFLELHHYNTWTLVLKLDYVNNKMTSYDEAWEGVIANIGDTIVEYENGKWGLIR